MIATNAQRIVDVRSEGYKPDELIIVSMIGSVKEPNHTVYAGAGKDYDWQWVHGLQLCIYTTSGLDWQKLATAIAKCKPAYLALWDTGRSEGAELWYQPANIDGPKSMWQYEFNYMAWTPEQNGRFA